MNLKYWKMAGWKSRMESRRYRWTETLSRFPERFKLTIRKSWSWRNTSEQAEYYKRGRFKPPFFLNSLTTPSRGVGNGVNNMIYWHRQGTMALVSSCWRPCCQWPCQLIRRIELTKCPNTNNINNLCINGWEINVESLKFIGDGP